MLIQYFHYLLDIGQVAVFFINTNNYPLLRFSDSVRRKRATGSSLSAGTVAIENLLDDGVAVLLWIYIVG